MSVSAAFADHRPLAFSIAYNMVGSVAEAEDIVQETFTRMMQAEAKAEITAPKAFIAKTATNLSIDHFRSARVRRETYCGEWIPEPIVTRTPEEAAEQRDTLSVAVLTLLEHLNPVERAVFVLREVLEFDFNEIAEIVAKSPSNCRQLLSRARNHVHESTPRFKVSPGDAKQLANAFFRMFDTGDTTGLINLLAADIGFHGDGGGNALGVAKPVLGSLQVSRFVGGMVRQVRRWQLTVRRVVVNGQPGALLTTAAGQLVSVFALEIADDRIVAIHGMVNPDKLGHVGPQVADIDALLAAGPPA